MICMDIALGNTVILPMSLWLLKNQRSGYTSHHG